MSRWSTRSCGGVFCVPVFVFFCSVEILVDHGSFRDRYFMDLGGMCIHILYVR